MKTLYIDCGMGAAGDMLSAALLELLPDKEKFVKKINEIGIDNTVVSLNSEEKKGIKGNSISVLINGCEEGKTDICAHEYHNHEHHHHHTSMKEIESIIHNLNVEDKVKEDVINIYKIIANAESKAHGRNVREIHFHEVGMMDAICDITMVAMLMNEINPEFVIASPVHVGSGSVKCAHGIMPVPTPATAFILEGIPMYGGEIKGELCTPTGAALLKYYVNEFGDMPILRTEKIGYGMGKKEFERVNCIRVLLGISEEKCGEIYELSCNVDDMSGEDMGYVGEMLFKAGAREVFTIPVGMKKNRTGILLKVICSEEKKEDVVKVIFKYTTTIGIRENKMTRYVLDREIHVVNTEYGDVKVKASKGYGIERKKIEYDDIARISREYDLSPMEVRKILTEKIKERW